MCGSNAEFRMNTYREAIPAELQTCGNCRYWQEAYKVEMPGRHMPDVLMVLAPCGKQAPERVLEEKARVNFDRVFMDVDSRSEGDCFAPSHDFLVDHPQVAEALAAHVRETAAIHKADLAERQAA